MPYLSVYWVLRYDRHRNSNIDDRESGDQLHPTKKIPGHSAADPSHPPCCHSGQDEVVEDDEDEHGGDDGGGERVDQLVVQLQVQVQVDGQAKGCDGEDLHRASL